MIRASLLAFLLATLASGPAAAQPADDPVAHTKQLYADGKRFYDVADYPKAIEAWKQAYVLASAPMLLFNIGQAYRLSGDCLQALRFYASYERESLQLANRDELEEARSRCDPHPTNANPPESLVTTPPKPVEVKPPVKPPVKPIEQPQQPVPIAPEKPEPTDPGAFQRDLGIGIGAAGLVLVGTSLVLGSRARTTATEVAAIRGEFTQADRDLDQHGHTLGTWSVVTGIAGVVGLASGAALYYFGRSSATVDVSVSSHSAGVSWSGSF